MIRMDISVNCDACGKMGQTLCGFRWIPGKEPLRPDLPKNWSLFYNDEMGWESLCPECKPIRSNK
jgi:hypothetical protein